MQTPPNSPQEVYPYLLPYFQDIYRIFQGDYDLCLKYLDKAKTKTMFIKWYNQQTRQKMTIEHGENILSWS